MLDHADQPTVGLLVATRPLDAGAWEGFVVTVEPYMQTLATITRWVHHDSLRAIQLKGAGYVRRSD